MAKVNTAHIERQKERLKLKSDQLNIRLRMQADRDKHKEITNKLKTIGGRVR